MSRPASNCFFILGCQRSGTTLTRLILESHPDVYCYDEATAYSVLQAGNLAGLRKRGAQMLGFKIPRWTEQFDQPVIEDEPGQPGAEQFYAGQPIIFMFRDARDVVASMVKLRLEGHTWLETWGINVLAAKLSHSPSFRQRFAEDIALLQEFDHSLAAAGALYWKYKTLPYFDYQHRPWPLLPVHYDRLVADPRREVRRITDFLGLDWHEELLQHHRLQHSEVRQGLTIGFTDPTRAIDASSVGQWSSIFTATDLQQIDAIAGRLNATVNRMAHPSAVVSA